MKKFWNILSSGRRALNISPNSSRYLSDVGSRTMPNEETALSDQYWKEKTLFEFNKFLPDIVRDLYDMNKKHYDLAEAYKPLIKEMQKKLNQGERNRGIAVLESYKILKNSDEIEPETERLVQIMGWCAEILHRSIQEAEAQIGTTQSDDFADYKINVSRMLESCLYQLLWKHFHSIPCSLQVLNLFQRVSHHALVGLTLDQQTHQNKTLKEYTMNRYSAITKYKTAYSTFTLPILLSLYLANVTDEEVHRQAKTICLEMGHFYQIQKDYQNCYGENAKSSNIANGKCDWLCVVALQRVDYYQKQLLRENYGKPDEDCVDVVKELYNDVGIPTTYKIYEERSNQLLCTQIQQSSRGLPHALFFRLMDRFYIKN